MPHIHTHLHLAKIFVEQVQLKDLTAFYLGNCYPNTANGLRKRKLHYKKCLSDYCDLDLMERKEDFNDFFKGYYFHLWVDNYFRTLDLEDINKYDALICDMGEIGEIIESLKGKEYEGKQLVAYHNLMTLEKQPMPLYLVHPEKQARYQAILEHVVEEFIRFKFHN